VQSDFAGQGRSRGKQETPASGADRDQPLAAAATQAAQARV